MIEATVKGVDKHKLITQTEGEEGTRTWNVGTEVKVIKSDKVSGDKDRADAKADLDWSNLEDRAKVKVTAMSELRNDDVVALHGPPKGPLHTIRIIRSPKREAENANMPPLDKPPQPVASPTAFGQTVAGLGHPAHAGTQPAAQPRLTPAKP